MGVAYCRDCLHDEACRSLLRHMGYTVDGDGDDADKRCDEFKYRTDYTEVVRCKDCKHYKPMKPYPSYNIADELMAEGVTVSGDKDINVPTKWISVKDRLPEQYHSVIVWTSDEELGEAAHDGKQFRWAYDDEYANVTHWMEMPQPPKGE